MYGQVAITFTPEQLVKEILSNVVDEILSERRAREIYGSYNITQWLKKNLIQAPRTGEADKSKMEFHRLELETIKLKEKYLYK